MSQAERFARNSHERRSNGSVGYTMIGRLRRSSIAFERRRARLVAHRATERTQICEVLNQERVDYDIVGGFASVVHGSSLPTQYIDLVPLRQAENLRRLAPALRVGRRT